MGGPHVSIPLWIFFVYAFLGWCTEVSYAALRTGKFVNRGFLNGPVCPIYGCGVVVVLAGLDPLKGKLRAAVSGLGGPHLRAGAGHRLCAGKAVPPAVVGLL
ncbi:MAG: putative ABC transporter permease [Lawsonibacter sp.]